MRKFILAVLLVSCSSLMAKTMLLLPNGKSCDWDWSKASEILKGVKGEKSPIDTLTPELLPPFYSWPPEDRAYYEATQFTPIQPCSVLAIIHGVVSESASVSKPCTLFIWNDVGGEPGKKIFIMPDTMTVDSANVVYPNICMVPFRVYVNGPFWVGNYEWDEGEPSTAFDTVASVPNMYNDGFLWWYPEDIDYFHAAIVDYDSAAAKQKNWTILVYMNGDNSLEYNALWDINEMEYGIDTSVCNVIVQVDRVPGHDASNGDWTTTQRYFITNDTATDFTIRSTLIADIGEKNMGDPNELINFVNWGITNYPEDNYMVVIWGDGDGWYKGSKGFLGDETSGDSCIDVANGELADALDSIKVILGRNIDILTLDASFMGLQEVAYEVKDAVNFVVFSEYYTPQSGLPYDVILDSLKYNSGAPADEFSRMIVTNFVNNLGSDDGTLSDAILDNRFIYLSSCIDNFAIGLMKAGGRADAAITTVRAATQELSSSNGYIDLYDFAIKIRNDANVNWNAKIWPDSVMNAISQVIIEKGHSDNMVDLDNTTGLAIYYPSDIADIDSSYMELGFAEELPNWWNFISGQVVGTEENKNLPMTFTLSSPMPNPVSANAFMKYRIPYSAKVELNMYDLAGNLVRSFYNGTREAGEYSLKISAEGLAKGIYFVRLKTDNLTKTQKFTVIK